MPKPSLKERKLKIRQIEREMLSLLALLDLTRDPDARARLWWKVEEARTNLEECCGQDFSSQFLRARESEAS